MKKELNAKESKALLDTLQARFDKHPARHKGIAWSQVSARLLQHPAKLWTLNQMEATGGEPDVIAYDKKADEYTYADCAAESPKERRSLCYDRRALDARKENKPKGSAMELAADMGAALLTESEYRALQDLGPFDLKTSSWIQTPDHVRKLGGALFCDRRYDTVFTYHNGAESYYAARGFRCSLRV